ncbi:MAG: prepilin-type N-terminal cleavage/methylation domain-containing protein, partial [Epsilonproteobacteria bacterium]|nr:prepilin-type N-terminal cleavage/methylation domain-containing protein [Campylobacterota bacterium]
MRKECGVTLIELLVSLLIFTIVIALTLEFFTKQLTLTTNQSGISESSQEALSAMETLRRDIETAGYGLPWDMAGASYSEATPSSAAPYNDAPSNPPRAIIIDNTNSYLVLKGSTFSNNKASKHWGIYDSSGIFHNGFSETTTS